MVHIIYRSCIYSHHDIVATEYIDYFSVLIFSRHAAPHIVQTCFNEFMMTSISSKIRLFILDLHCRK